MSIKSVIPSNHSFLCHPLFLLPSIFLSIRVFSNKLFLCIRWPPKYWSFSFSINISNKYSGLISFRIDCLDLLGVQGSSATPQFKNINSSVLSHVQLFATPWTTACQASQSITNSQSLLKLMSIKSVMPSNHLILCCPLLLLPSIFPSIRDFSNKSVLLIRWPKYWSFSFSISPSNGCSGLISFRIDCFDLLSRVFASATVWKHQLFGA